MNAANPWLIWKDLKRSVLDLRCMMKNDSAKNFQNYTNQKVGESLNTVTNI